jgi:hypothetical protein
MDTYMDPELDPSLSVETLIQVSQGSEDTQTSPYSSVSVIFMRLGIAKIDQQTIAEELGDVPVIAANHLRTGGLVGTYHVSVHFGVEVP